MSFWHRLLRCPPARRGLLMLLVVILVAVAAPLLAPSSPWRIQPTARLLPPLSRSVADAGSVGPTLHLLGTDSVGRDVLSRLIYGSRLSLTVGFTAMVLSALFGSLIGVLSGYFGGIVESLTAWLIDVQLSFPFLLLAIFLLGALGGGTLAVIFILALATWVNYARIVRAQVLSIKHQGYVEAAHSTGASVGRVLFVHILPNTLAPICVVASFSMAQAILTEAGLSFLGVGLDPSTPSWGTMLNDGRDYLLTAWWISTMPGIAIGFTVLGVMFFGEGLRELLDPRGSR
ncbi:MAG TPA: ABC transporter permease [Steroidobacteraceae bacterium]|nr:ABC transporter permease [Steroidobacteraceae bacterium]